MSTRGTRKPSTRKTTKADKVEKPVKEDIVEDKTDDEEDVKEEVKEDKPVAPKPIVPKSLVPPTPTPSPSTFKSEKSDDDKKEIPDKAPILTFDDVLNGNFDKKPPTPKSITEFDYDEIRKTDVGSIKKFDNITLMKILVVRGHDEKNPAIWQAMQRLLKQVNCEFDPLQQEPVYQQRDFHQQRRDYDSRSQGRGGFVPRGGFNGNRGGFNQGRGGFAPRNGFNQGGRGGYQPEQRQMPTDD